MHDNHARFAQGNPLGSFGIGANKEACLSGVNERHLPRRINRPQHDSDSNVATTRWNYMKIKNTQHQTERHGWEEDYILLRQLQFHNLSYKQLITMFA
jgi:hypothetical protein